MLTHFGRKLGLGTFAGPRPERRRLPGWEWFLAPGADRLLGRREPDVAAWSLAPWATTVKENLQRTVLRVDRPGAAPLFVKLCRANTPRSWLREWVRPPKARLEWENAAELRRRGVGAVEPVAWGRTSGVLPGASAIVTRAEVGSVPLPEFLKQCEPPLRRRLARSLARFLARMHDAGATHPDPHPGNLLVRADGDDFAWTLLDVHAVRFGSPPDWPATRDNLTLFNRYFQLRASRADRLRFWRAYAAARTTLPAGRLTVRERGRELESATAASNRRFWSRRVSRYFGNNSEFRRVKVRGARAMVRRDAPEWLRGWASNPDAPFEALGAEKLKDSRTSTVVRANGLILKRFRVRSWVDVAKNLFRPPQARRSWALGQSLLDRSVPTAKPLAWIERRRFGVLPAEGYLAFETVPEASDLHQVAEGVAPRDFLAPLARLVRRMHDHGVQHRDLKATNVLLSRAVEPVLIDLVGVQAGARPAGRAARVQNLARLAASFVGSPRVRNAERLRFLRAYLRPWESARGGWKAWWRDISAAVTRKVEQNRRRGRVLR